MAQTTFTDGVTAVAAAFLNKIFTHVHDGLDQDGSAPKVDLGAHTNLDTGGAAIKGTGAAVAWIVYSGNGTVLASKNVDVAGSTLTGSSHSIKLDEPARTDLDASGGAIDHVGAALVSPSTGSISILPGARYRKQTDNSEVILLSFINRSDGLSATPGASDVFSVVAHANIA